ncbi:class I SAM-dependent methyltransferase [Burkholderia sp. SRS-46]|nr:class I SAM-dependent methyltransferase [Burkholderia sp. SRS-46]
MMDGRRKFFESVYKHNAWASGESRSGAGSELWYTKRLIEELPGALRKLDVSRVLDVPCGDFNWMKEVDLAGVEYIGGDIVPDLVEENTAKFGSKSRKFVVLDIVSDELPSADLLLVRDCFIHFSNDLVLKSLRNIVRSDIRYIGLSTVSDKHYPDLANSDLERTQDGVNFEYRPIKFEAAPFSFPPPVMEVEDGIDGAVQWRPVIGIWETHTIRTLLSV